MKNQIINFIKTDRTPKGGLSLYKKFGKKQSIIRNFNTPGNEKYAFEILMEEFRVLAGITIPQFENMMKTPVVKTAEVKKEQKPEKEKIKFVELPEKIQKTIKLREEFPFLKSKDCPEVLKVLVADMLTTYHDYMDAQEKLFDEKSDETIAAMKTVENYLENREAWDELNYYKEKGEFLGKHSIFEEINVFEQLREMNNTQLFKRLETLKNGINRKKKEIEKNDKPDLKQKRTEALKKMESELKSVKRLLNIND